MWNARYHTISVIALCCANISTMVAHLPKVVTRNDSTVDMTYNDRGSPGDSP